MPFDFMKKAMMVGIGIAMKTQSEIEEITKEFVNKTKMTEEEGQKFVDDMSKKYDEARQDMEKKIREWISDSMAQADIASKKELDALKKEVEELKKACGK
jgi:polyhydroxyalkanoate synthesis regulator phasin